MSFELVNTLATLGTFVVIAATAIAAIVQLRHMRGSNHIIALNELRETMETPSFQKALHFVQGELSTKLQDPTFRHGIVQPSARNEDDRPLHAMVNAIGNFYESAGVLVSMGLVDRELVARMWCENVIGAWKRLAPVTAIARRSSGEAVWENFEYLAVISQDWLAAHPNGVYPVGLRRIDLEDAWLETDRQYAAATAPA